MAHLTLIKELLKNFAKEIQQHLIETPEQHTLFLQNSKEFFSDFLDIELKEFSNKQLLKLYFSSLDSPYTPKIDLSVCIKQALLKKQIRCQILHGENIPKTHPLINENILHNYRNKPHGIGVFFSCLFQPIACWIGSKRKNNPKRINITKWSNSQDLKSNRLKMQLLAIGEEKLKNSGFHYLSMTTNPNEDQDKNNLQIFIQRNYSFPENLENTFLADITRLKEFKKENSWINEIPLPKDVTIIPWKKVIENKLTTPKTSTALAPPKEFNATTSLAAIKDNLVIGWIITQKLNEKTLFYRTFFVEKNWRHHPLATLLLFKAFEQHYLLKQRIPYFTWKTTKRSENNMRFIENIFSRYIVIKKTFLRSSKCL
jgi:hypothetical protein